MLLICAGMMRSGSVVQFQLAGAVVNHLGIGSIVKPRDGDEFDANVNRWAFADEWYVAKLHDYRESIKRGHDHGRVKVVMVIRDPRDIMVSLMNFRQDSFETMQHAPVFPNNLKNHKRWSEAIHASNFRCVKYEEMVKDLANEVAEIEYYALGSSSLLSVDECIEIGLRFTIKENKLRAIAAYPPSHLNYFSKRHINDGRSGQWKTALDEDQIRWVEQVAGDFMETNGYELAYPSSNHTDI